VSDALAAAQNGGDPVALPPQTPGGPVRVGGDIQEPKKIRDVKPVYPPDALAAGLEGVVIMEAIIGTDGTVADVSVVRSVPGLDQAAVDALQQWKFTPTRLNGEPVEVLMTVTVNFTLH
jgi:protein TonB